MATRKPAKKTAAKKGAKKAVKKAAKKAGAKKAVKKAGAKKAVKKAVKKAAAGRPSRRPPRRRPSGRPRRKRQRSGPTARKGAAAKKSAVEEDCREEGPRRRRPRRRRPSSQERPLGEEGRSRKRSSPEGRDEEVRDEEGRHETVAVEGPRKAPRKRRSRVRLEHHPGTGAGKHPPPARRKAGARSRDAGVAGDRPRRQPAGRARRLPVRRSARPRRAAARRKKRARKASPAAALRSTATTRASGIRASDGTCPMSNDPRDIAARIRHEADAGRALRRPLHRRRGQGEAELVYRRDDAGQITILHTGVPPAIGGRGIAGELVRTALDWAKAEGLKVAPGVQLFEGLGGKTPGVRGAITV